MTFASVRAAAEHVARVGRITPHQLAALTALDEGLSDEQRARFTELWRAEGSPAGPVPDAGWIVPARKIVKEFEGCRLQAYLCPAGVWTIGWGSTTIGGKVVREGQRITQAEADAQLDADLQRFHDALVRAIPAVAGWPGNRAAALVSWTYNVGVGAMQDSTLRRRLLAGEAPAIVISQELPRWIDKGLPSEPGLTRRRAAEVALFVGQEIQQSVKVPNHLRLTRTGDVDRRGLELLRLEFVVDRIPMEELLVVSGAPGRQGFRRGQDSRAGSLEPLPEGRYRVGDIEWKGGKDVYAGSWGAGLGPVWVGIEYESGTTARSALGIHLDENQGSSPGTAGCVGIRSMDELKRLVSLLRKHDPKLLFVDWKLGTCPPVKPM
jgi:GH24 family phage-related lysozyme (muramidase)